MDHSKRGIAVIFNAERFNLNLNLNTRSGSRNDYDYLIQTLISLGFKIWKRFNPTHTDVIKTLETGESYLIYIDFICLHCLILKNLIFFKK